MALVVSQSSELKFLEYLVGVTDNDPATRGTVLHLYMNSYAPVQGSVIGSFTECTQPGYGAVTLSYTLWTNSVMLGVSTAVYSEQTFNFSTNAVAWGYYVTTKLNELLWAETFTGAPFQMPDGGGQVGVALRFTAS